MGMLDTVKDMVEVVRKLDNVELYRRIVELQGEIVTVVTENAQLKAEVRTPEEKLRTKQGLIFESNAYWIPEEKAASGRGPFCSNCWDSRGRLVHLITQGR